MPVHPLGDAAAILVLGETVDPPLAARIHALATAVSARPPAGVVEVVPAFASVAVILDPARAPPWAELVGQLERLVVDIAVLPPSPPARCVEVPVCYGGEHGPDLIEVADRAGLAPEDVVRRHAAAEYRVYAIGFTPGFPYLGGLPAALATPRRRTPRARVPAGSVGIGGAQTGVYPLASPGGWNLIGCTPHGLFDAHRPEPSLLRVGDQVLFRPIDGREFAALAARAIRERREPRKAAGPPAIEVRQAGMFTTVQDGGRRGRRSLGVPLSGAADPFALRLANMLVGNPDDAAGLEFTLRGPALRFERAMLVAAGGADFPNVPRWRPFVVPAGATLDLGTARAGCRGYLAVAGGISVAPVLGSASTYTRAALGGIEGRALRDGDTLSVPAVERGVRERWFLDERLLPPYAPDAVVRTVDGLHAGEFDPAWRETTFRVSPQSDRMGIRLAGAPLCRTATIERASIPVVPGTIQAPPDGQPIVLLADAQTIGGYPQVAHVASVDLPLLAQLRPGDRVRFVRIELEEARTLVLARDRALGLLREGLAQKLA